MKSRRKENPQKPGRKKWIITDEMKEQIKQYSACGLTKAEIYQKLGIGHNTFYARLRENPELGVIIEEGRIESKAAVTGKLFNLAVKGNCKAAELYLKFVHRMTDRHEVQVSGSAENPLLMYISNLTPEEIDERYQQLMKKSKGQ